VKNLFRCLLALAACVAAASGRDFTVSTISATNGQARLPAISPTGLVAWQQSASEPDGEGRVHVDICTWKDGTLANRTADNPLVAGHSYRPRVFGDSVVFSAVVPPDDQSGIPFRLSVPDKTEAMAALEEDYPSLFGPVAPENAPEGPSEAPSADGETDGGDEPGRGKGGVSATGRTPDVILCQPDGTIRRITAGNTEYTFPVGSDSALAFLCARTWPYGYDLVAWKTGAGELTQITTNYFYVQNPCIHGHELVFQAWDGHDYEIYLHDFDTGETRAITQNNFDDTDPVIWDGIIAWVAYPTVNAEIFLCEDGAISKISTGSTENASPSIWDGRVVWQGVDDDGDTEIYYYHNRRTVKLTSNTWDDVAPCIADGMVAWSSYIDNWDAEAVVLDLSDNILFRLTDNAYEDINVQTAGEKVVWQTLAPEGAYVSIATPVSPRESEIP
jgi:hypothetical protein